MSTTIRDIAKIANVSITTVSRVVNNKSTGVGEETRQRILKLIKELDYHPNRVARGLVTKRTNILGLILPDITNPFFPEIVRGAEDAASNFGYNIMLCNTDDNEIKENEYIQILKEKCVDGIIYTSAIKTKKDNINTLLKYKMPFVLLDRFISNIDVPCVYVDGEIGMYKMIKYLIHCGHKRIAYISGPKGNLSAEQRLNGYLKALRDNNVEIDHRIVKEGNYKINGGSKCIEELLKGEVNFTAVACANDMMAVGALDILRNKNIKVPEDVSITGYDDVNFAKLTLPKLTTVIQPTYKLGSISVKQLVSLIENKSIENKRVILEPEIAIRDSVFIRKG